MNRHPDSRPAAPSGASRPRSGTSNGSGPAAEAVAGVVAAQLAASRAGQGNAVPRLALSVEEACQALGVGWDFWHEHIAPEVRIVRRGRRKLIPVTELQRWLAESAEAVL